MDNYVLYVIVLLIIGFKCMCMENLKMKIWIEVVKVNIKIVNIYSKLLV